VSVNTVRDFVRHKLIKCATAAVRPDVLILILSITQSTHWSHACELVVLPRPVVTVTVSLVGRAERDEH